MQFCKKIQFGLTEPHKEVQHEKFRSNQGHQGPPKRSPQNRQENRSQADGIPDKRKKTTGATPVPWAFSGINSLKPKPSPTFSSNRSDAMTLEQKMDFLIENGIATEEEIKLVTCINGWNDETFDDIYYARAGPLQGQPLLARSPRRRNHGLRDGQSRREHELRRSRKPLACTQGCAVAGHEAD